MIQQSQPLAKIRLDLFYVVIGHVTGVEKCFVLRCEAMHRAFLGLCKYVYTHTLNIHSFIFNLCRHFQRVVFYQTFIFLCKR